MHAYVRKILKNCPYCMSLIYKTITKNVLLIAYYTANLYSKITISVLLLYRNIYRVIDDLLVASRPEFLYTIYTATKTNSPTLDYNVTKQVITYKFRLQISYDK
jgi:hypothetical protein